MAHNGAAGRVSGLRWGVGGYAGERFTHHTDTLTPLKPKRRVDAGFADSDEPGGAEPLDPGSRGGPRLQKSAKNRKEKRGKHGVVARSFLRSRCPRSALLLLLFFPVVGSFLAMSANMGCLPERRITRGVLLSDGGRTAPSSHALPA